MVPQHGEQQHRGVTDQTETLRGALEIPISHFSGRPASASRLRQAGRLKWWHVLASSQ